jgi:ABC-type polysaccharide/polyol phosphate transport system ATPase subunit
VTVSALDSPVVIEARGVGKAFRIPEHKVDTLKERALHPLTRPSYRRHLALEDVSFDVHRGEFFGIVGRNGSGKSTLLKILASIYLADAGRVRMAGRMAPFIELGVGFNPELTARENCELGGVLMGLSRREARRRLDAILDFGELREFIDLKVKNYSSGMMVRLAFSIMVQADADIMLIDEVLAVGDAAFAQKCMDVFHRRREAGKTVVIVTHDMAIVQSLCHRAMLIHDARVQYIGEPDEAAMRYLRTNFGGEDGTDGQVAPSAPGTPVLHMNTRLLEAHLVDQAGRRIANVEQGQPLTLDVALEAVRELDHPVFVVHIRNVEGLVVFGFLRALDRHVAAGTRLRLQGEIENRLVPGSYWLECWVRRDRRGGDMALQPMRLIHFVVYGTAPRHGVVTLETTVEPRVEDET